MEHPNYCGLEIDTSSVLSDISDVSDHSVVEASDGLRLYDLKLFGRDQEVSTIRDAFGRVCKTGKSEVVFCHGVSGVGKSKLIVEAVRDPVVEKGGFFVTGKFDQHLGTTPFSALVSAFSDICDVVGQSADREDICKAIKNALGAEMKVLARLIPSFSYLMSGASKDIGDVENSQQAFMRFKVLCRKFLQSVSSAAHPVIFMLDDLQWADEASAEVIQSLLKDDLRYVLILGSYRDDEVDSSKPLQTLLTACEDSLLLRTQEVALKGLDLEQVNQMVSFITYRHPDDTMPLSAVILGKTRGNSYFCLHFLEMLERQDFLYISTETNEWEWDLKAIQSETNAADNVATLVADKVRRAQTSVQLVLLYSSYLGYQFSKSVLQQILICERKEKHRGEFLENLWTEVQNDNPMPFEEEDMLLFINQALDKAIADDLVETIDKEQYKFAHDRVQDSLLSMVEEEREYELIRLRVGRILHHLSMLEDFDDNWLMFIAVNSLNSSRHWMNPTEQINLVQLNLEAGFSAATKCAYLSARDYLSVAVDLLHGESWDIHYDLCLKAHDAFAEFQLCSGDSVASQSVVDIILMHARSRKDRMKAYLTQVSILSAQGRLEEAIKFGLEVIAPLGFKFPRKPTVAHVALELVKAKITLRNMSCEDILSMPQLEDEEMRIGLEILSYVGLCAFFLHDAGKFRFATICLRGLRLATTIGLGRLTPQAFAAYATILSILGQYDTAIKYAHLSKKITDEIGAQSVEARCICMTHGIVHQAKTPLADLREGFGRGYRLGMEHADVEYSLYDLHDYIMIPFLLGSIPFSQLEQQAADFCQQAEEFHTKNLEPISRSIHQDLINLMGINEFDPSKLFGEVADDHALVLFVKQTKNTTAELVLNFHRLMLAYHFKNTIALCEVVELVEKLELAVEGHYMRNFMRFYRGMAYYLLFETSGQRKHRRRARKMTATLQGLAKKGVANIKPLLGVLQMEKAALSSAKFDTCCELACEDAFEMASIEGFNVTLAIAYERAACIMIQKQSNCRLASQYMEMAVGVYGNIEAAGKVAFLEEKYCNLIEGGDAASGRTGMITMGTDSLGVSKHSKKRPCEAAVPY